jgi:hypothetical protein
MRKFKLFLSFTITAVVLVSSCQNSGNTENKTNTDSVKTESGVSSNSLPDISGHYKMGENTCGFELIITKGEGKYTYNIKGKNGIVDLFGDASVSNSDGTMSVSFTLPESFSSKTADGVYTENSITIQNYGNAENQFEIFKDCGEKYMEFKK